MFQEWLKEYKKLREENNMSEEFSFDIDLDEIDKLEVLDKMQKELEASHQRFMNGTETIDDLINHIYYYKIENNDGLDLDLVEKKYYEKIVDLYKKEKEENKKLKKCHLRYEEMTGIDLLLED